MINDPIVDALIDKIITAHDREDLIAACRALDRVLLWSHYVIPQWHNRVTRIAFWDKLDHPATWPRYGVDLFAWWVDPGEAAEIDKARQELGARRELRRRPMLAYPTAGCCWWSPPCSASC